MGKIRVNLVYYPVLTLGPFDRVGVWLQGCSIRCPGCMSKHTWSFSGGYSISVEELCSQVISYNCKRLTISGGEPLDQYKSLLEFLSCVRPFFQDILLYTGYELSLVERRFKRVLELVDVLIAGPYLKEKPSGSRLKGSENQQVLYLKPELEIYYRRFENSAKVLQRLVKEGKTYILGVL